MHFQLLSVTSHDQLHNLRLDKKKKKENPPKRKLISLCGRCSIMTSEYMAPYIHVGGCTVTHLSAVYVPKTPVLNHCSRTKGYWYKTKNHSGPALDSRDSLTTRRGILRPFPGVFTGCGHFHSSNFTHPGAGWQSFPPQTHLYIQNIQTRKSTLDKICSAASIGVISWTIQAQIHQKTFTPTFLYLLDLCWVSVGFGACFFFFFFVAAYTVRQDAHWESCHSLPGVAHMSKQCYSCLWAI